MAKTISLQPVVTYPGGVARNADALLRETGGGGGAVDSVNGKVGKVVLTAADVHARADNWTPTAADVGAYSTQEIDAMIGGVEAALAKI